MAPRVFWIDAPLTGRLAIMPRPMGGERLVDEIAQLKSEGITTVVSLLDSDEVHELELGDEENACALQGLSFFAFPIADRGVPDEEILSPFADCLAASVKAGASVVVHCRAGIGRSSLVAAAVLARCGIPPTDALQRISVARGLAVPDTGAQRAWVLQMRTQ